MKAFELVRRCLLVPIGCLVMSYVCVCVYWIATGCRYGVRVCSDVFIKTLPYTMILSGAAVILVSVLSLRRISRFRRAMENCKEKGADEESLKELNEAIKRLEKNKSVSDLLRASALLSCGLYEECCEILQRIGLRELSSVDEEEYFNMLIYCRLMQGERELAVKLYLECGHYFNRALLRRGTSHIRHTVGMIYYTVGEYDKALKLFEESKKEADESLLCECDLWEGLCWVRLGNAESARDCAVRASENVSDKRQEKSLEHLMRAVTALANTVSEGKYNI